MFISAVSNLPFILSFPWKTPPRPLPCSESIPGLAGVATPCTSLFFLLHAQVFPSSSHRDSIRRIPQFLQFVSGQAAIPNGYTVKPFPKQPLLILHPCPPVPALCDEQGMFSMSVWRLSPQAWLCGDEGLAAAGRRIPVGHLAQSCARGRFGILWMCRWMAQGWDAAAGSGHRGCFQIPQSPAVCHSSGG